MSYSDNRIVYSEVHMLAINSESTGKLYVAHKMYRHGMSVLDRVIAGRERFLSSPLLDLSNSHIEVSAVVSFHYTVFC